MERIQLLRYLLIALLFSFLMIGNNFRSCAKEELKSTAGIIIKGEQKKWHKVTLELTGPVVSEQGVKNPFLDYRLEVKFQQGNKVYLVPGYYAADGNAGESGAISGNVWKVHFTPDATGTWEYEVSFRAGSGIAVSGAAGTALPADGARGSFTVGASDKALPDNRARGRLQYVGGPYLRYAESGEYFLKGGPDSPENFLAYADFDGTQNNDRIFDRFIKSWSAHEQDWRSGDPVWQGGKGKGIIGAINYLASEGLNIFSFLTLNILGDDKNVFPYVHYNGTLSDLPVAERLRFDVSKLDQWEIVFEHAEHLGMFLHLKLQEARLDMLLDGGKLGVERKLYYREMMARFGHHLAMNWNLGEESNLWVRLSDKTNEYLKQYAAYFAAHDPYHHLIVVHTYPEKKERVYPFLLGAQSEVTGASLQSHYSSVHQETAYWLERSVKAGKPWVVTNDEQNPYQEGVLPDGPNNNHALIRQQALWGNLMAGGSGCEFYFGSEYAHSDITCQDWRSRDAFWDYVRHALRFFRQHIPYWQMENMDALVGNTPGSNAKYCMGKAGEVYVVYLANGGSTQIDLSSAAGTYTVQWYNPRKGGKLVSGSVEKISGSGGNIGQPPVEVDQDWVAVLQRSPDTALQISKLVLYDTETQSIIADPMPDGAVLQLDDRVSVVAVSNPTVTGSVIFELDGQIFRTENVYPYAVAGDDPPGVYYPWTPTLGEHILKATPYTEKNGKGEKGTSLTIRFNVVEEQVPNVQSFTLVNAATDQDIGQLSNGDVIHLGSLPSTELNIRANTFPEEVGSVVFELDGKKFSTENVYPYALASDTPPGEYNAWTPSPGSHTLTATPYLMSRGGGEAGMPLSISFEVVEDQMVAARRMPATSPKTKPLGDAIMGLHAEQIWVYPNPGEGMLSISLPAIAQDIKLYLYNAQGNKVMETTAGNEGSLVIDVSHLASGLYLLKVASGQSTAMHRILLK